MDRNELLASEAAKILAAAAGKGIPARLLGGLAVYLTCPCTRETPFRRDINDIDFIVTKRRSSDFGKLLAASGYAGDHQFNSIHGESRLLFTSEQTDVDVFVGVFQQCHALDLDDALKRESTTIPLAELLLTKLQIVQINRKDEVDILSLLNDHAVVPKGGPQEIDLDVITAVVGNDWGWYTTATDNLDKLDATVDALLPDATGGAPVLHARIATLRQAAQSTPKSMKWKMRDKVGRRVTWYDMPEEKKL